MASSVILIGQPDSGKSNYLGRAWESIRTGQGALSLVDADDIEYLEELLTHLLHGTFAPRSDKNVAQSRHDVRLTVKRKDGKSFDLVVPDVTGELWRDAVADSDLPHEWMTSLEEAEGALLFLRVGSEENHQPLDWVTSRALLALLGTSGNDVAIPTQVVYSELLRFLQVKLGTRSTKTRRKVAIVITAWDRLDPEYRDRLPIDYLTKEFPLLAGRIKNIANLDVKLFGVSVVGGDLESDSDFRLRFKDGEIKDFGYTVNESGSGGVALHKDLTLPLNWLMEP